MRSRPLRLEIQPRHLVWLAVVCVLIAGVVLAWRFGPLRIWGDPTRVAALLGTFSAEPWAPLAMIAIFVLAAIVFFPVLVLIAATALAFEPWRALSIAMCGVLASTSVLYALGTLAMRGRAPNKLQRAVERIDAMLHGRDIVAVMLLRMIPIAPSTLVSISLGVLGIPLRDALIGTALGMAPGMIVITALGRQLRAVMAQPTLGGVAMLAGLLLAWLALGVVLQRVAAAKQWRTASLPPPEPPDEHAGGARRPA